MERLKGTRGQASGWVGLFVELQKNTSGFLIMFEIRLFKSLDFSKNPFQDQIVQRFPTGLEFQGASFFYFLFFES